MVFDSPSTHLLTRYCCGRPSGARAMKVSFPKSVFVQLTFPKRSLRVLCKSLWQRVNNQGPKPLLVRNTGRDLNGGHILHQLTTGNTKMYIHQRYCIIKYCYKKLITIKQKQIKKTTLNILGRYFLRNASKIHQKLEGASHTKPSFLYSTGGVVGRRRRTI